MHRPANTSDRPLVSVVLPVHNGARTIRASLESVRSQVFHRFEMIVVDDGSTDSTPRELSAFTSIDPRIRVITLPQNEGITKALIRGCAEARGDYIARHDCGDTSERDRLVHQFATLREKPNPGVVGCEVEVFGPGEEPLYVSKGVRPGMDDLDRRVFAMPHHGCAMFARALYEKVGGYRPEFYYAQDCDLWSRLTEHGPMVIVDEVLYRARLREGSLSFTRRREQERLAGLVRRMALARQNGGDEKGLLAEAERIRPGQLGPERSAGQLDYFVSRCLAAKGDPRAAEYARRAWSKQRFSLRYMANALMGGTRK